MEIKQLTTEEDAVSPVIGVILMVAITVILAVVIGAFVIGIGDDQEVAPQASWSGEQVDESPYTTDELTDEAIVEFAHGSGDTISEDRLSTTISATTDNIDGGVSVSAAASGDVSAGQTVDIEMSADVDNDGEDATFAEEDDTVNLVWESSDGGSTSTLTSFDLTSDIVYES